MIVGGLPRGADPKLRPLALAVIDEGSHLLALQRPDGMSIPRPQVARGKAVGALPVEVLLGQASDTQRQRAGFFASLVAIASDNLVADVRDVAQIDGSGARIGDAGDTPDDDELTALADVGAQPKPKS